MKRRRIYRPLTAAPFLRTGDYAEFEPCEPLKPYIRCFWGTRTPVSQNADASESLSIVIPDTCVDIIFRADLTNNRIESSFCGIDDRAFITRQVRSAKETYFIFAIRFYAWGAPMFAQESMRTAKNAFFDAGCHFPELKKEIERLLFDAAEVSRLIPAVERILLRHRRERSGNRTLLDATARILDTSGTLSMSDLGRDVLVSGRQLERLFLEYIGISPKGLASMVRYQSLWRELLSRERLDIADAACRYGYSDQAHLCHDFRKYHSMNMSDARRYALQNVGNIQDSSLLAHYNRQW